MNIIRKMYIKLFLCVYNNIFQGEFNVNLLALYDLKFQNVIIN